MNKLMLYKGKTMTCLLFSLLFFINGCKKDFLIPKKVENTSTDKIRSISYSQFINAINLNSTGSLKAVLSGQKTKFMSTQVLGENLDLEMDSVKKLTLGDTISYVIAIKPQTPRATTFQNLTIQVIKTNTTAFLSTYYPEKEWLNNWRKKLKTKFKGTIVFNKIHLDDIPLNDRLNTTGLVNRDGGLKDKLLATVSGNSGYGNVISLAPGECEFYDVFTVVAYPCSTGDMPGHCAWESDGGLTMGMLDYLPGYRVDKNTVINCAMPNLPSDGGGGGGAGSTTPNPPGTYNPCDGTPQPVGPGGISFERGTRLMVGMPTDCDEIPGPPVTTTTQTPQQYLMNHLDLDAAELNFVNNPLNVAAVAELSKYLINNGTSIDNIDFIHWAVGYLMDNPFIDKDALKNIYLNTYSESEMLNIVNLIEDPVTGNGIDFYLILNYRGSKLLNLSRGSSSNTIEVGAYTLMPHYDKQKILLFYAAARLGSGGSKNGIEYIIRADQINAFRTNVEYYAGVANWFYLNGIPSSAMIKYAAGKSASERVGALGNLWVSAVRSPSYWAYLGTTLLYSATLVGEASAIAEARAGISSSEYTFTKTAERHLTEVVTKGISKGQLQRPYMDSPLTIQEIMATGPGTSDATYLGGMNWRVSGTFRGSNGTWELGINPQTKVIYHFNFTN